VHDPDRADPRIVRYALGGIPICAMTADAAIDLIVTPESGKAPVTFHFSSAKDIVEAASDANFMQILNCASFVLPDGMPLAWYGRLHGHRVQRISGTDTMLAVLDRGRDSSARHYFYGGAPGVSARLAQVLERRLPGLTVVGHESPPFRPLTPDESAAVVARMNAAGATHVWVGIGSPKQDFWIAKHSPMLRCGAVLSVGAAFDYLAGTRRRAPRLMQKTGTEWFYRLLSEPRRLGRRYTVTNARFLAIVAHDLVSPRFAAPARITDGPESPHDDGRTELREASAD
jgi:N-acetylglucosaminyldiphosphoundecaprenol N-acetyl-beta-D-mannosaminyltransferase